MHDVSPIRLGVAGLGRGFVLTLPSLIAHPDIRLVAAFDPRAAARTAFAEEFGGASYEDFPALAADGAVDAIYLASPHEHHAEQAIAAAGAGKHVLVEKPMTTSISAAAAMVRAAAQAGTILIAGPSHGFDAPVMVAAQLIAERDLGDVRMVTSVNYTDYLYRFRRPEEFDTTQGGGVVHAQAPHQIDVARRLVGSKIRSIRSAAGSWDPARPGEGAYAALVAFENGAVASLTYSGYGRYDSDELVGWVSELGYPKDAGIYGEARRKLAALAQDEASAKLARGYGAVRTATVGAPPPHHEHFGFVLVSCERGDLRLTADGVWLYADRERLFIAAEPPTIPRAGVIDELVGAIRGQRRPVQDGEWGLVTVACCAALLRSAKTGAEIGIEEMLGEP